MRIIAGSAKGARLATPSRGTRPMTGRARESLFSIIGGRIPGASVLDLFAGSGSLGLEALSRGAASALFVERDRAAATVIQRNIESVGLGGIVVCDSVARALKRLDERFDLVFVDPPYADDDADVSATLLACESIVAPGALVIVHRQAKSGFSIPEFLTSVDERRYGDAVVTMMERIEP